MCLATGSRDTKEKPGLPRVCSSLFGPRCLARSSPPARKRRQTRATAGIEGRRRGQRVRTRGVGAGGAGGAGGSTASSSCTQRTVTAVGAGVGPIISRNIDPHPPMAGARSKKIPNNIRLVRILSSIPVELCFRLSTDGDTIARLTLFRRSSDRNCVRAHARDSDRRPEDGDSCEGTRRSRSGRRPSVARRSFGSRRGRADRWSRIFRRSRMGPALDRQPSLAWVEAGSLDARAAREVRAGAWWATTLACPATPTSRADAS